MADFIDIDETYPRGTQKVYVLDDAIRETRIWMRDVISLISGYPDINVLYLAKWTTDTRPVIIKDGLFGYNETAKKFERNNGTAYAPLPLDVEEADHADKATMDNVGNTINTYYAPKESPTLNNPVFTGVTKGNFIEVIQNVGNISMSAIFNCSNGNIATATLTGNCTIGIIANAPGYARVFTLLLTNGGNYTITWDTPIKWTDGADPVLTSNGKDLLSFLTLDNGVTWYGSVNGSALS